MRPQPIGRPTGLLLGDHLLDHTRAEPSHVLGDAHRPQPVVERLIVDLRHDVLRQRLVLVDVELVGHELGVDEVSGGLAELLQFGGEVEVHWGLL